MLNGEIRGQIDRIWDSFWSGGISNPLEVMEQITYLLFLKRLDELQTLQESKAATLGKPVENAVYPQGDFVLGERKRPFQELRWSRFKNLGNPQQTFEIVGDFAFPFLRTLGGKESTYSTHMESARFTIPTPALLAKVIDFSTRCAWMIGTPRVMCMSTCSARSRRPGRTASSARLATSSS